jgi:hypothetical protein
MRGSKPRALPLGDGPKKVYLREPEQRIGADSTMGFIKINAFLGLFFGFF